MEIASLPPDEARRLAALQELELLDTPPEEIFDDIVRIASSVCGVPIALITLVDAHRQWFKARIGLDAAETSRDAAFCAHAILDDELFVVHDAKEDRRFFDNPLVTGAPHLRFYAGAPLSLPDGNRVGTLCILDRVPRSLTTQMRETLLALKRQTEASLALHARAVELRRANAALLALQAQKERLVRFVVHDMKNAVSALTVNATLLLEQTEASTDVQASASDILESTTHLGRMLNDMLDIAGAELGSPLRARTKEFRLGTVLDEIASTFEGALTVARLTLERTGEDVSVRADPYLVRRVLENLLANAMRFAPPESKLLLEAERRQDLVRIVVTDEGPGIAEEVREAIFEVYGSRHGERTNYGIGLVFCRAAMTVQRGRIWVEARQPRGTRVVLELPAT